VGLLTVAESLCRDKGMDAAKLQVVHPLTPTTTTISYGGPMMMMTMTMMMMMMMMMEFIWQVAKEYIQMYGQMGSQSNTMIFSDR